MMSHRGLVGINVFTVSWRGESGGLVRFLPADFIRYVLSVKYHLVTISLCHQSPAFMTGFAGHTFPAMVGHWEQCSVGAPLLPSRGGSARTRSLGSVCLATLAVWLLMLYSLLLLLLSAGQSN